MNSFAALIPGVLAALILIFGVEALCLNSGIYSEKTGMKDKLRNKQRKKNGKEKRKKKVSSDGNLLRV